MFIIYEFTFATNKYNKIIPPNSPNTPNIYKKNFTKKFYQVYLYFEYNHNIRDLLVLQYLFYFFL